VSSSRRFATLALVAACSMAGCSSCSHRPSGDGGVQAAGDGATASAGPPATPAPLSLPIAADHDAKGNVYVAGFVAARGAISLSRFDDSGRLLWAVDVLGGLAFSPDERLDVMATSRGPVVAWHGLADGGRSRVARLVSEDGKLQGAPFATGAGACATRDALYWIGSKDAVVEWPLPSGPEKKLAAVGEGRDPTLVCGDARAFLVDDGEDDIAARTLEAGKAGTRSHLLTDEELGDDDMREHDDYSFGDTLADLLLTEQGHLTQRRFTDKPSPRAPLAHVVGNDEDLMAVDGNASRMVAILTRDASARCDGDIGTDVLALDVADGSGEHLVDVARGDCAKDLGPYWVGPTTDAVYVAWNVRGPRSRSAKAPVEALAWAKLGAAGAAPDLKTVPLSAEDVVFAGCGSTRCWFAALARPEGTDGMVPGEARVIAVP